MAGIALLNHMKTRAERKQGGGLDRAVNKLNVRAAVSPARYIYGEARTGGVLAYLLENEKDLWVVYALSKGACDSITGLYIEGVKQTLRERSGTYGPDSTAYTWLEPADGKYENQVQLYPMLDADGDTSGAGAHFLRAVKDSEWTTYHAGGGVAYVVVQTDADRAQQRGHLQRVSEVGVCGEGAQVHSSSVG